MSHCSTCVDEDCVGPPPALTGTFRPGVGAAVLLFAWDPQNGHQVLLGRRAGGVGNGTWGAPGGHVEHGELGVDAALRELLEEAGVTLPQDVRLFRGPYAENVIGGRHYVTLYFIAYVKREQIAPVVRETEMPEWRWVGWGAPEVPVFAPTLTMMGEYPDPTQIPNLGVAWGPRCC